MAMNLNKNNLVGISEEDISEFTCGICYEIFVNPVFTQCCRQTYCFHCINKWLEENNTCPNDRALLDINGLSETPRDLLNLFNNLKIKCDFHLNGCQEILKVNDLANHISNCSFRPKEICKICDVVTEWDKSHDCLENLRIGNNNENESLNNEIRKLNEKIEKPIPEKTIHLREGKSENSNDFCYKKFMENMFEFATNMGQNGGYEQMKKTFVSYLENQLFIYN